MKLLCHRIFRILKSVFQIFAIHTFIYFATKTQEQLTGSRFAQICYFKISVGCEVHKSGAALTQPWANDKHPACIALLHLTHILHKQKGHK